MRDVVEAAADVVLTVVFVMVVVVVEEAVVKDCVLGVRADAEGVLGVGVFFFSSGLDGLASLGFLGVIG